LELIGVIREDEQGNCVIRNRIYERVLETHFGAVESDRSLPRRKLAVMIAAFLGFATVIMALIATVTRSAPFFVIAMISAGLTLAAILFNLFVMQ